MKKAIIILPTYNEKENIEEIITVLEKEVFPKVKNYEMGILVADDSSPDRTADIVHKLMKKYKNLDINTGQKKGLGAAYIRGMIYAIDIMGADVVFEMDADFQHDPHKIPLFLNKIDEGYDIAIGTRYSDGGSIPKHWGIHRKFLSIVGNTVIRLILFRFTIHDWTGGFRAIKKEVFLKEKKKVNDLSGYYFQVGFLLHASHDGFSVAEIPFHFGERTKGESKIPTGATIIKTLIFVIKERIRELGLVKFVKFVMVGGFGFSLNAVALFILVEYFHMVPAFANLIGAALAIFSNYNFNNVWTFREHRVTTAGRYFWKMFQFYVTSAFGVIIIQTGTISLGDWLIGRDYYFIYFLVGTFFLLIWNFTIYNKIIWRKKKTV